MQRSSGSKGRGKSLKKAYRKSSGTAKKKASKKAGRRKSSSRGWTGGSTISGPPGRD